MQVTRYFKNFRLHGIHAQHEKPRSTSTRKPYIKFVQLREVFRFCRLHGTFKTSGYTVIMLSMKNHVQRVHASHIPNLSNLDRFCRLHGTLDPSGYTVVMAWLSCTVLTWLKTTFYDTQEAIYIKFVRFREVFGVCRLHGTSLTLPK